MSTTKSGLILIAVSIGMNVAGRVLASLSWMLGPALVGAIALWMIASLVVGLFGVFRLIVGLLSRKKQARAERETPPSEGVWPPAPEKPHYKEREN